MATLRLECLRCGETRTVSERERRVQAGECERCGYVGWAQTTELSETLRKILRERPHERRRLFAV
jgi:ribosomal protein S27AE